MQNMLTTLSFPSSSFEDRTFLAIGAYALRADSLKANVGSTIVRFTASGQTALGSGFSLFLALRALLNSHAGRPGALTRVGQEFTWMKEVRW